MSLFAVPCEAIIPPTMSTERLRGKNLWLKIFYFYYDGFREMTLGKTLWIIILLKLFVFFVVLKLFFFPDLLQTRYGTDGERAERVSMELTDTH